MKSLRITDIVLCVFVIPGMILFFPVSEWAQWNHGYIFLYILWLYGVYFLCRKVLGNVVIRGRKGLFTTLGAILLTVAATFLMTLVHVDIPREEGTLVQPHVRAMWIMLFAVLGMGLPLGSMEAQLKILGRHIARETEVQDQKDALHLRASNAFSGEEVLVKSGYKTVHIPLGAVQYIESRNNYSCFHLDHLDDVVTQVPLKDVMDMLPEGKFLRIHRSYIVPVWRIEKRTMTYVKIMGVEDSIPVGRAYKDILKNG
ncbi:MAG: LytTR family transcriptional regulator [Bacteroidales bacterium]|nr:LytTR family transcriptional regulator [Bacteroidales bacterium]